MPDYTLHDEFRDLWQDLTTNAIRVQLEELHERSEELRRKINKRRRLGMTAACVVIAGFGAFFFVFPNLLERIGSLLTLIGAGYVMCQLQVRKSQNMPPGIGQLTGVEFYRSELERQRNFHRGVWFWSRMVIFLPGPVIFLIGLARTSPKFAQVIEIDGVILTVLATIAVPLNLRLASRYQRRIDELNTLLRDSHNLKKEN